MYPEISEAKGEILWKTLFYHNDRFSLLIAFHCSHTRFAVNHLKIISCMLFKKIPSSEFPLKLVHLLLLTVVAVKKKQEVLFYFVDNRAAMVTDTNGT